MELRSYRSNKFLLEWRPCFVAELVHLVWRTPIYWTLWPGPKGRGSNLTDSSVICTETASRLRTTEIIKFLRRWALFRISTMEDLGLAAASKPKEEVSSWGEIQGFMEASSWNHGKFQGGSVCSLQIVQIRF